MTYTNDISSTRIAKKSPEDFRTPHYDCQQDADAMQLIVYVPGVVVSGVDITMRGPDLAITARKERHVRPNWNALQLEHAQHDYRLSLRIGYGYDPSAMTAEISNGILTIALPNRARTKMTKTATASQLASTSLVSAA